MLRTRSFLDERRENLAASAANVNGIAGLEVDREDPRQLSLRFVKPVPGEADGVPSDALASSDFTIAGGDRIRSVAVVAVVVNGDVLGITVNEIGDFSTYTLSINADVPGFDPILRHIDFGFRAHCDTGRDCEADPLPEDRPAESRLDYLARDYESYRRMMLDRMAVSVPQWTTRNPASLGVTLVEALAYLGDRLSYDLDQVETEYSLETARFRVSAARHARLVGYRMHNGASARVMVAVDALEGPPLEVTAEDLRFITRARTLADPVIALSDVNSAAQRGAVVFEPCHSTILRAAHNAIALHPWGDADAVLPKGTTTAWLADPGGELVLDTGNLLILEQERDPVTGRGGDADPAHRQAIRLIATPDAVEDPLTLHEGDFLQVLRVQWAPEDALQFDLCIGARPADQRLAVARGNVIVADHGMSTAMPEALGQPGTAVDGPALSQLDRPRAWAPMLQTQDLTYAVPYAALSSASAIAAIDPTEAEPAIHLEVTDETRHWFPAHDLLGVASDTRAFVPEISHDGRVTLRFGQGHDGADSTHGRTPRADQNFSAIHRTGTGLAGNIGAGGIAHVAASSLAMASVLGARNPLPATGGAARETIAQVRQRAPISFRRQRRAVTLADYEALLTARPDVQRALARKRWLGAWSAIFLSVDRANSIELDEPFRAALLSYLEPYRMMGHDLAIDTPVYVPIELDITACAEPDFFAEDVSEALVDAFAAGARRDGRPGFFHPDNVSFGARLYLSRIYEAALAVPGVADVNVTLFRRAGLATTSALDAGVLEVGPREIPLLENDPNRPGQGRLSIEVEGGR